ncbi:MAG: hypothetical protein WD696_01610 [Bryobacteraceae bacterium]
MVSIGVRLMLCGAIGSLPLLAQSVISARAGLIHYTEGRVLVNDKPVISKPGTFSDLREKGTMRTEAGRAEILLTPGAFLRIAEKTSIRMLSDRLSDTQVEFLGGSVLIEVVDLQKENAIAILAGSVRVMPRKEGIYRLDSNPLRLRVYDGEAQVASATDNIAVKGGRELPLEGVWAAEKFNAKTGDAFHRWSRRRAEYIAVANISAAKSLRESGWSWERSGWRWNPHFSMYTFVPLGGARLSPFGYRLWAPRDVDEFYAPRRAVVFNPNYGYRTMRQTNSGYSGTVAATPRAPAAASTAASGASTAPVSRESGRAGGRNR